MERDGWSSRTRFALFVFEKRSPAGGERPSGEHARVPLTSFDIIRGETSAIPSSIPSYQTTRTPSLAHTDPSFHPSTFYRVFRNKCTSWTAQILISRWRGKSKSLLTKTRGSRRGAAPNRFETSFEETCLFTRKSRKSNRTLANSVVQLACRIRGNFCVLRCRPLVFLLPAFQNGALCLLVSRRIVKGSIPFFRVMHRATESGSAGRLSFPKWNRIDCIFHSIRRTPFIILSSCSNLFGWWKKGKKVGRSGCTSKM